MLRSPWRTRLECRPPWSALLAPMHLGRRQRLMQEHGAAVVWLLFFVPGTLDWPQRDGALNGLH